MKKIFFVLSLLFTCYYCYAAANTDFQAGMKYYKAKDFRQAFGFFEKAAEQNNPEAQYYLGQIYHFGNGVPMDNREAFKWYKKAAKQGNADAQSMLGWMYQCGSQCGRGIPKDLKKTVFWYRKAAEQGNTGAQSVLCSMYYGDQRIFKNYKETALDWLKKSSESSNAKYLLGIKYYFDKGTIKDKAKAVELFKKSAEHGNAAAQCFLGDMYRAKNNKEAFKWFKKAAEQDNYYAQFFLGNMYRYGEGIQKNIEKAKYWINSAYVNNCSNDKDFWKKYEL